MIGYVTLGTNDLDRSAAFYDALLAELGAKRAMESDEMVLWAVEGKPPAVCAHKPFDGKSATIGNGVMVALAAESRATVDALYEKAISLGATDEGAPGPRGDTGFYAGYFRDPDGTSSTFTTSRSDDPIARAEIALGPPEPSSVLPEERGRRCPGRLARRSLRGRPRATTSTQLLVERPPGSEALCHRRGSTGSLDRRSRAHRLSAHTRR